MKPEEVKQVFKRLKRIIPSPTTELRFSSNFELLVAVILSAQATDVSVNKVTEKLYTVANTPEQILNLGLSKLKSYIKTIGLYNNKANNIIATCKLLIEKFNSEVPRTLDKLQSLPGVGRKTANVVLNTAFGKSTIAVDTHIFRVANRIGLAQGKTPLEIEQQLLKIVPNYYKKDAHHLLILHGRHTCKARTPQCKNCSIIDICRYPDKVL